MGRRYAFVLAVAMISLAAIPAVASAKHKINARFMAEASHGYRLGFVTRGKPRRGVTLVQVSRLTDGRKAFESVSDLGERATFRDGLLKTKLGDARVAVRFEPGNGNGCSGKFVGRIRYRGEHGFTNASLDSAKGYLRVDGECADRDRPARAQPVDATLLACGNRAHGSIDYTVFRPRPRQAVHLASRWEFHGRDVRIRDVGTLEPAKTFVVAPDLLSATVTPHLLFSGSAEYADDALTGDLKVSFPGRTRPDRLTPLSAAIGEDEVSADCGPVAIGKRVPRRLSNDLYSRSVRSLARISK